MLLIEQNDEWLAGRRYLSEFSLALVLAGDASHGAHTTSLDHKELSQLITS